MNLKQLEAFVKVAETKSFSAAARQLYLTQPTVSAHIASLEKELNACLLVRSTKGVALSEAGKELYAYAEQMLELEQKVGFAARYRAVQQGVAQLESLARSIRFANANSYSPNAEIERDVDQMLEEIRRITD